MWFGSLGSTTSCCACGKRPFASAVAGVSTRAMATQTSPPNPLSLRERGKRRSFSSPSPAGRGGRGVRSTHILRNPEVDEDVGELLIGEDFFRERRHLPTVAEKPAVPRLLHEDEVAVR